MLPVHHNAIVTDDLPNLPHHDPEAGRPSGRVSGRGERGIEWEQSCASGFPCPNGDVSYLDY